MNDILEEKEQLINELSYRLREAGADTKRLDALIEMLKRGDFFNEPAKNFHESFGREWIDAVMKGEE